jgi:hypothetical protein
MELCPQQAESTAFTGLPQAPRSYGALEGVHPMDAIGKPFSFLLISFSVSTES